jgi:hypothetical protein
MTLSWENIKNAIEVQPMPEAYKRDVDILCYDCGKDCVAALHYISKIASLFILE